MRRAQSSNGFEVVIKAPTLGLFTRIPGEQPDPRAATAASNVRFAEGVAMNAPGYGVLVTSPRLPKIPNLFLQITFERGGKFSTSSIIGTSDKLYSLFRYPDEYVPDIVPPVGPEGLLAITLQIRPEGQPAVEGSEWLADGGKTLLKGSPYGEVWSPVTGLLFITADGPATAFGVTGAPAWMTCNEATGELTGEIPEYFYGGPLEFSFDGWAENSAGRTTETFRIEYHFDA
jgi:hypothetical protein